MTVLFSGYYYEGILSTDFCTNTALWKNMDESMQQSYLTGEFEEGDCWLRRWTIITLRPRQNGRHIPDDIFKCIFVNENVWIPNKISPKFGPKCATNNIPALVQIMAWRRPGDKPLSEPMMVNLPKHIYTRHSASMRFIHRLISAAHTRVSQWNVASSIVTRI